MKLELYKVPDEENGKLIENFLIKNNLSYKKILTSDISLLEKTIQAKLSKPTSILKIKKSHSISVIVGFNNLALNQILEHINKYKNFKKTKCKI